MGVRKYLKIVFWRIVNELVYIVGNVVIALLSLLFIWYCFLPEHLYWEIRIKVFDRVTNFFVYLDSRVQDKLYEVYACGSEE